MRNAEESIENYSNVDKKGPGRRPRDLEIYKQQYRDKKVEVELAIEAAFS